MSEEQETKKEVAKQFVVNTTQEDKDRIASIKEQYGLSDKNVIKLLIEVALSAQKTVGPDAEGNPVEVDNFAAVIKDKGLVKPKVEKKKTLSQKEKLEAQLAEVQAKLAKAEQEAGEPETVVVDESK